MSTYSIQELLDLWAQSRLTAEQAVGHLIQNFVGLAKRLSRLEDRIKALEQTPHSGK